MERRAHAAARGPPTRDSVLLWATGAVAVWIVVVLLIVLYATRDKHCATTYERAPTTQHKDAIYYMHTHVRPMTRWLKQAQACIEDDLETTCGLRKTPRTTPCFQSRLHAWRRYVERKVRNGAFPEEAIYVPLRVSDAHNIVLTEETDEGRAADQARDHRLYTSVLPARTAADETES